MKLGIDLAREGTPPLFCESALVTSRFPDSAKASTSQRTRWEHGHLGMILREVPAMIVAAGKRRDIRLLGLALDLAVPPLALLAGLLVLDWLLSFAIRILGGGASLLAAVSVVLLLFFAAVLLAWRLRGRDLVRSLELLSIPWYVLAKIPLYIGFLVRRQKAWIRTDRE